MTCEHTRGDFISDMGYWVCSDCWQKLPQRPFRLGMTRVRIDGVGDDIDGQPVYARRQDVVWRAGIHTDAHGNTLGTFLRAMAKRFQFRTRPKMSDKDAYDLSISVLQSLGDEFGDPAYDWSAAGAREFADEEMQYFDEATGGNT